MNPNVAASIIAFVYGALSVLAAIAGFQTDGQNSAIAGLFLVGGMFLLFFPFAPGISIRWTLLMVGLVTLHGAALWQGFDQGEVQWSHHTIRLVVSMVLISLFVRHTSRR